MHFPRPRFALVATYLLVLATSLICMAPFARADTYDFAYTVTGDAGIAPINVFDNGKETYFQFREGTTPAVFAVTPAGSIMLTPYPKGQFHVVGTVEKGFLITVNQRQAEIRYAGDAKRDNPAAMFGSASPANISGSAPAPVPAREMVGNRVASNYAGMRQAAHDRAEQARVNAASPPPSSNLPQPPGQPAAPAQAHAQMWEVVQSDALISKTFERWAKEAGWQLVWEAPRDFPVTRVRGAFPGTFQDAIEAVVIAYSVSDSPIKAVFHDDMSPPVVLITKYQGNSK